MSVVADAALNAIAANPSLTLLGSTPYLLEIPPDMLVDLPAHVKTDDTRTADYLQHGLKLGLAAMAQAVVSLNTTEYMEAMRREFTSFAETLNNLKNYSRQEIEQLIERELTGENSALARELKDYLSEKGRFATTLEDLHQRLSNPEHTESIPHKVNSILVDVFEKADSPFRKVLSVADKDSPLFQLLDHQRQELANHKAAVMQIHSALSQEIQSQFELIKTGLNIQELLQQRDAEQALILEKSGQKGKPFEVLVSESLELVTRYNRDTVANIGDLKIEGTQRKIGDVLIEIYEEICQSLSIVVEVKSGQFTLTGKDSVIKQTLEAMQLRKAQGGIVAVQQKYAKANQPVYSERGGVVVVVVDPENEESGFLPLEVAYMTLRARLLVQHSKSASQQLDIAAIEQTIAQLINSLSTLQSVKIICTTAKTNIDQACTNLQNMETTIKQQVTDLRLQLGLSSKL